MDSKEDYDILTEELMRMPGIKEIAPYSNNSILKINYSEQSFNQDGLMYKLWQLGYGHKFEDNSSIETVGGRRKGG